MCNALLRRLLVFAPLLLAHPHLAVSQENCVALVVGNSSYRFTAELKNPRNDAADIASILRTLGFRVVEGLDLDKPAMESAIRSFAEALVGADKAVFFYAGHGLQVSEQNYLIPIDAKLTTPIDFEFEVVRLDIIQRAMERSARSNVLFVDACRDNPLARTLAGAMGARSNDVGRGMARSTSSLGTLISFSTQPGNVALDGDGRNSPFAAALKQHIAKPVDDLSTILINVRNDVVRTTAARQVPWEHSSLWERFYFATPASKTPVTPLSQDQQLELALWNSVKDSANRTALRSYLDRYPQGTYAIVAKMFIARLERWDDQNAGGRQGGENQLSSSPSSTWRPPRTASADGARCVRLYALLAARAQEIRQQCGSDRLRR